MRGLSQVGRVVVYEREKPQVCLHSLDSVRAVWQARYTGGARARLLMGARGLDLARFQKLYARRDDRMVFIHE